MPGESKYSQRRISAVAKQRQALELRMAGRTWQEIANTLHYRSHASAIYAVQSALKKTLEVPAEEWRALTIERLTKVLQVFWMRMVQGDEKATDRVLHAITDLRELLGLDAPIKAEITGKGGGAIEQVITLGKLRLEDLSDDVLKQVIQLMDKGEQDAIAEAERIIRGEAPTGIESAGGTTPP